jgi:hypothetical protein
MFTRGCAVVSSVSETVEKIVAVCREYVFSCRPQITRILQCLCQEYPSTVGLQCSVLDPNTLPCDVERRFRVLDEKVVCLCDFDSTETTHIRIRFFNLKYLGLEWIY